jgi:hypothetical protein
VSLVNKGHKKDADNINVYVNLLADIGLSIFFKTTDKTSRHRLENGVRTTSLDAKTTFPIWRAEPSMPLYYCTANFGGNLMKTQIIQT